MRHLRNRIFYTILIPTLVIFLLISSIAFIQYRSSYKESTVTNKEVELLNISRVLGDWISTRVTELMTIANSDNLRDETLQLNYLKDELNRNRYIFDKLWINKSDETYINTNNQHGLIFTNNNFDKIFSKELLFSYSAPDRYWKFSTERFLIFSVPITENDKVVAVLSGSFPVTELERVINLYIYNVFDAFSLIDVNDSKDTQIGGKVILHSNFQNNGKQEVEVMDKIYSSNTYNIEQNYFVTDLINNWKLICMINSKTLYSQLKLFSQLFIFLTLVVLVVISILSIGISNSISNPILQLQQMVNKMLQGDFKNEISLKTQDELQELAEAFNQLNRRNIQLRTDDRFIFLGRISSRMAHEIRHPLHIIQIAMQTMNSENFVKNGQIISQEIKKADLFIREVLEIAKPNELSLQYYSMNRLLESILKSVTLLKQEKSIKFEYNNISSKDSWYFDVLKMEQVITNIINNSFEATPPNGIITIELNNFGDRNLQLIIKDTGPGFDEEIINRVFDPYFTTKKNGTGLGLSICYQIITAHGAHIELSNRASGGAITKITFFNRLGNPA